MRNLSRSGRRSAPVLDDLRNLADAARLRVLREHQVTGHVGTISVRTRGRITDMALLNLTEQELRRRTSIKWRRYPADVLPMWVAEMDVATPVPVRDALVEAITIGDTGYPSGRRYPEAFSSYAEEVWGWPLDPALVHTVDAVMGSIHALLEVTTSPGDGVLINTPVYPPFRSVVTDTAAALSPCR